MHPDGVEQNVGGKETKENRSPDTTKASKVPSKDTPQIQDNSFLVEEAYNQEFGVVQHIQSFSATGIARIGFTHSPRNGLSMQVPATNSATHSPHSMQATNLPRVRDLAMSF